MLEKEQDAIREGADMSISLTGINAYRRNEAALRRGKAAGKAKDAAGKSAAPKCDRLELQFTTLLQAEEKGYIEVNGMRFSVPDGMAAQMRTAYDEMLARNEKDMERQAAEDNAKAAEQRLKALEDYGKAVQKAMEIARRIAKGGHVPPEDEQFLMEFSQEMFMAAKMESMMAKEHKKYDSILDEEEEAEGESEAGNGGGDGTRASAEVTLSDSAVQGVCVSEVPVSGGSAE